MRREPATIAGRRLVKTGLSGMCTMTMALRAAGVEQLETVGDRLGIVLGLDRGGVGGVDPDQRALLVAEPDRHRRRGEHGARRLDLGGEQIVARLDLGARQAFAGEVAEAGDRGAADGAAAHLDQPVAARGHNLLKMLAVFAQVRDELIEAGGRIRASARCRRRGTRRGRPARRRPAAARRRPAGARPARPTRPGAGLPR